MPGGSPRDALRARPPDGCYIAYQVVGRGPDRPRVAVRLLRQRRRRLGGARARRRGSAGLASFSRLILHDRRGTGLSSRNVDAPQPRDAGRRPPGRARRGRRRAGGARRGDGGRRPERAVRRRGARTGPLARLVGRVGAVAVGARLPVGRRPELPRNASARRSKITGAPRRSATRSARSKASVGHLIEAASVTGHREVESPHGHAGRGAWSWNEIWNETDVRERASRRPCPRRCCSGSRTTPTRDEVDVHGVAAAVERAASRSPGRPSRPPPSGRRDGGHPRRSSGPIERRSGLDTILSTVLFTDIVDSTQIQAARGDRAWKELVLKHHAVVREALARWRGHRERHGGRRLLRDVRRTGARDPLRDGGDRAGPPPGHRGAGRRAHGRVRGDRRQVRRPRRSRSVRAWRPTPGPSEVLVSQTVKDLVAGSGLTFEDAGEHELKGVPDRWRLYRVVAGDA